MFPLAYSKFLVFINVLIYCEFCFFYERNLHIVYVLHVLQLLILALKLKLHRYIGLPLLGPYLGLPSELHLHLLLLPPHIFS